MRCLQYMFYSLLSQQKHKAYVMSHQYNPEKQSLRIPPDPPPPVLNLFPDGTLLALLQYGVLGMENCLLNFNLSNKTICFSPSPFFVD